MASTLRMHAGDTIAKTLTFTLTAGEAVSRVTLLLTRADARGETPTVGRARCIVLASDGAIPPASKTPDSANVPAATPAVPRTTFVAEVSGTIPSSICGGDYVPVFCTFDYTDGRAPTGFEVDADQRFALPVADDASAIDAGPAIVRFS